MGLFSTQCLPTCVYCTVAEMNNTFDTISPSVNRVGQAGKYCDLMKVSQLSTTVLTASSQRGTIQCCSRRMRVWQTANVMSWKAYGQGVVLLGFEGCVPLGWSG